MYSGRNTYITHMKLTTKIAGTSKKKIPWVRLLTLIHLKKCFFHLTFSYIATALLSPQNIRLTYKKNNKTLTLAPAQRAEQVAHHTVTVDKLYWEATASIVISV